ncbi:major facilitator superfamily domain-containing protein [Aspergillus cavernicola]|uniref:Major facilitator superfamily domain-containing protein n=1 Tax=Aspergillus cavernicola TaxID=176166 RepID=A0ABR4IGC8_9EURO
MHARTPRLPVQQLFILSICRIAEPIAVTSYLPYLPEMVESVGVPEAEIAKWAGLTTAVASFCQAVMAVSWGTASDRYGRKPIILLGLIFTMFLSLAFGLSTSLPMLIACRAMIGLMNGNVGIIRTMVAEMIQDKELQPRAFSIMPMVWTIGSIFGPAFGGSLAHPAEKYPEVFGNSRFLKDYPFALPNMVSAAFFIIGITTGYLFLHETLAAKKGHRDAGLVLGQILTRPCARQREKSRFIMPDDERTPLLIESQHTTKALQGIPEVKQPRWREVFTSQSALILLTYALMSVHTMAFDSLFPVFLHNPVQRLQDNPDMQLPFKFVGGCAMDSQQIGMFYTLTGIIGMVMQFYVFPTFAKRFGVLNCVKAPTVVSPILYLLTPYIPLVPESMRNATIFSLVLAKLTCAIFIFPCITILLTNSASSLSILGTLNGVATSVSAIGRAAGPAVLGPIFSLGVRAGYIIIPWWFLSFLSVVAAIPVLWIVESDSFQIQSLDEPEPILEQSLVEETHPIKYHDSRTK